MKKVIISGIVIALVSMAMSAFASEKSLREIFVASENVYAVYPMSDNITYVIPDIPGIGLGSGNISTKFIKEFAEYLNKKGLKTYKPARTVDPVTGKSSVNAVPFTFGEVSSLSVGDKIPAFVVPGVIEVVPCSFRGGSAKFGGYTRVTQAIKVTHTEKQPFAYKMDYKNTVRWNFDQPVFEGKADNSGIEGIKPRFFGAWYGGTENYAKASPTGRLFVYLMGHINQKKCTPKFLVTKSVNRGDGRFVSALVETDDPFELYNEMNSNTGKWYLGCEKVEKPFVALKDGDTASVYNGRTTDGVDYRPLQPKPAAGEVLKK